MDPEATAALDYLDKQLSDCARRAWGLIRRDQRFREICKDYAEAMKAAELWSREDGRARKAEFHRIAMDLQGELLEYLNSTEQAVGDLTAIANGDTSGC